MVVKGPIPTPHAPNTVIGRSTARSNTTAEVSQDSLRTGIMVKHGVPIQGRVKKASEFYSDTIIKNRNISPWKIFNN